MGFTAFALRGPVGRLACGSMLVVPAAGVRKILPRPGRPIAVAFRTRATIRSPVFCGRLVLRDTVGRDTVDIFFHPCKGLMDRSFGQQAHLLVPLGEATAGWLDVRVDIRWASRSFRVLVGGRVRRQAPFRENPGGR